MFVVAEENAATFVKFIVAQIGRIFYKVLSCNILQLHLTLSDASQNEYDTHTVNSATKIVADTHQPPDPTAMKLPSPPDMDLFRNELPGNQTQQEYVTFHNKRKAMYASVRAQSLLTSI